MNRLTFSALISLVFIITSLAILYLSRGSDAFTALIAVIGPLLTLVIKAWFDEPQNQALAETVKNGHGLG